MKEYIVPCDDDVSEFESMKENTELIRCKDCRRRAIWKHGSHKEGTKPTYRCVLMRTDIEPDDFCSRAERRTDEIN